MLRPGHRLSDPFSIPIDPGNAAARFGSGKEGENAPRTGRAPEVVSIFLRLGFSLDIRIFLLAFSHRLFFFLREFAFFSSFFVRIYSTRSSLDMFFSRSFSCCFS